MCPPLLYRLWSGVLCDCYIRRAQQAHVNGALEPSRPESARLPEAARQSRGSKFAQENGGGSKKNDHKKPNNRDFTQIISHPPSDCVCASSVGH